MRAKSPGGKGRRKRKKTMDKAARGRWVAVTKPEISCDLFLRGRAVRSGMRRNLIVRKEPTALRGKRSQAIRRGKRLRQSESISAPL